MVPAVTGGDGTTRQVTLDWGPVEVREIGERREPAPVLVFLHEGLGAAAHWKDFPDAIAAATGLPAIVYSRYGYGRSGPAPLPRPVSYMHVEGQEVLPALLEALEIRRPILVGHSDGASIALIHAALPDSDPLALVLEAPHVFVEELSLAGIRDAKAAYESGGLRDALARWHDDVEGAFRGWNDIWLNPDFRAWNIEGVLKMIRCPILQIQGRDDAYGTAAQLQSIEAESGGPVQTLLLDDCGHAPHRDRRAATEEAMTAFIRRVTA
ncbi:alpha/beta fold hydrolase [Marinibaculum pumilum]|uniref:Alpha/beta fold hydrolase n=1 Tax=Marinibaculum pumilum TaxID=1766165 RepID=A0ABV7KWZ8_9PROT